MNPITYHDCDIFLQSTKYQSNRPTMKRTHKAKSIQTKKKQIIKIDKSSKVQNHQKKSINNNAEKHSIKHQSIKNSKNTSILCTLKQSPQEYSTRNNNYETERIHSLAQANTRQLYIQQLQKGNSNCLRTINLLQEQIIQKNSLLDQCHSEISFLKHKFAELFQIYNNQMKKFHNTQQKTVISINQGNQRFQSSNFSQQQEEIVRRIEYSEDTLKLSLASSSLIKTQEQILHNNILQQSTIQIPKQAEYQFFDTINDQQNSNQTPARTPLQNLSDKSNHQNFSKVKTQIKTANYMSNKLNLQNLQTGQTNYLHQQTQNYHQSRGILPRKQSVSAITTTHRLAAFYQKKLP